MYRTSWAVCLSLVWALAIAAAPASHASLSAAQVAEKNVQARGGLAAWRAVQSMTLEGKMGAGGNQRATLNMPGQSAVAKLVEARPAEEAQLPFVMELKRPRKMRFELQFNGQTAVQVYDGANGWKLRPFLNRRAVEPYTSDEVKIASAQAELDGPLVDYAAKGTRLEMVGMEKVEGRDTYQLKMTMKNGDPLHVWIDAETFLEAKIEGQRRRLDGTPHPVEVYFRDYRNVNGLQIPFVLETKVLPVAKTAAGFKDTPVPPERINIDKVSINPTLQDTLFTKPELEVASNSKK